MGHSTTDQTALVLGYGFTTLRPGPIWPCDSEKTAREIAVAPHLRAMQRTVKGWVELPVERPAVTLTKDAVTLYDVQTNAVWDQMSHRAAEAELAASREAGDLHQEYDTTDRQGRPLRIVLQVYDVSYDDHPDLGGIYEFTR